VVPLLLILYVGAMQLLFNSLLDDNKVCTLQPYKFNVLFK
jgi:hypothetical protein